MERVQVQPPKRKVQLGRRVCIAATSYVRGDAALGDEGMAMHRVTIRRGSRKNIRIARWGAGLVANFTPGGVVSTVVRTAVATGWPLVCSQGFGSCGVADRQDCPGASERMCVII